MLKLVNIKKDYLLKDQEPVHALKGISLNFRSNEFVAILGHSGCGKTTLLNIIGGLDHYDSGDLIIKGRSTKDFKDNDWDTYRNHSIGFVFQTYNLIPHQNILSNVELALTIAGLSKEERIQRAKDALDKVGLKGLYKKKPNQMSGGQMQRVAIARALVNNPEIVLADEPTGALDSETSIQIMDLLKEVAKDHLVIMVTHNPELADKYATRIVKMKDGEIYDDSNVYKGDEKTSTNVEEPVKGKKQSSMSFFTATGLSLSNLWSKFKRTALVVIAGSIGIIGVSTIIGASCGVNNYIYDMQDDMLSAYPLQVAEESVDMTSLLTGLSNQETINPAEFDINTKIGMDSLITYLLTKYTDFTNIKTNDINEYFVEYVNRMPKDYYSAVSMDYSIDPTNNFFTDFKKNASDKNSQVISLNGLTQQYIKTLMTVRGFSSYAQFVDLFTGFMKQLPAEQDYIMSQYDFIDGVNYKSRFPTKPNELLLVVDPKQTLTDLLLAQLGYYPQDQFLNLAKVAVEGNEVDKQIQELKKLPQTEEVKEKIKKLEDDYEQYKKDHPYESSFDIDEILNHNFYYVNHSDLYQTGSGCMVSHKQIDVSLAGDTVEGGTYYLSLRYDPESDSLSGSTIEVDSLGEAKMHTVLAYRFGGKNVTEGKSEIEGNWFMANLDELSVEDTQIIGELTSMTIAEAMSLIKKYQSTFNKISLVNFSTSNPTPVEDKERTTHFDATAVVSKLDGSKIYPVVTHAILNKGAGVTELEPETPDYYYEAVASDGGYTDKLQEVKVVGILKAKPSTNFGTLNRGVYFNKDFRDQYMEDAKKSNIYSSFEDHIKAMRYKESSFNCYVQFEYDDYTDEDNPKSRRGYASALNGDQQSTFASIFASFLSNGSDNLKTDKLHLRAISGQKVVDIVDEDDNTKVVGHEIKQLPQKISIYPKSFEDKDKVTSYLDEWNDTTKHFDDIPDERSEITYTDTIGMIITVISTLVEIISIALIVFTSLSLVVSCFMIAVITYISVMERVKEIGVIRSLGGRKKDVSRLFIAENITTGVASGLFGIVITYVLQLIINFIVSFFGVTGIVALPWYYALMMIGIATLLSVLSGLIPSFSASKQDPVIALRTE